MAPSALNALDQLAATLVDSQSGGEESAPEAVLPEQVPTVDDDPPPISKRKRGPGKKKSNDQPKFYYGLILTTVS
jgi:hypothetical protein